MAAREHKDRKRDKILNKGDEANEGAGVEWPQESTRTAKGAKSLGQNHEKETGRIPAEMGSGRGGPRVTERPQAHGRASVLTIETEGGPVEVDLRRMSLRARFHQINVSSSASRPCPFHPG